MSYEKEPSSTTRIRFQDCDPFGHLNNARYIDYFMNARQDHLEQFYGFKLFTPHMTENWVVIKTQIAYLEPALLMEEVLIRTRLIHLTQRTLLVEGLMLDKDGKRLKSLGWVEFMYVSLATGRPALHTPDFQTFAESLLIAPAIDVQNFNDRVQTYRREIKAAMPV